MRTKLLIIVIIAVVAAYFLVNNYATDENTIDATIVTEKIFPKISINPIDDMPQPGEKHTNSIQPKSNSETLTPIISDLTFSSDPVVNAHAIFRNNQLCYSQLENSNSPSIYMQQFLERMDNKQAEYFKNYLDYCRELDKQHPEYSLTNKDQILANMKGVKANSLWGKILSREVEVASLSHLEIKGLLKSNNINILQEAPQYFESYYQEIVHWDLESYLGNHDYDYVTYIRRYAHQMYLCNIGTPCQSNSTIMANLCYRDQSACGLDFSHYINNSLTPGQQADIQLALNYLRSQYQ